MINLATHDLNGDGIPEIALASGFSMVAARSQGDLSILSKSDNPDEQWLVSRIDRIPTSHRLRWIDLDGHGNMHLVNAPLIGQASVAPDYRGTTPIYIYENRDLENVQCSPTMTALSMVFTKQHGTKPLPKSC